MEVEHEDRIIL